MLCTHYYLSSFILQTFNYNQKSNYNNLNMIVRNFSSLKSAIFRFYPASIQQNFNNLSSSKANKPIQSNSLPLPNTLMQRQIFWFNSQQSQKGLFSDLNSNILLQENNNNKKPQNNNNQNDNKKNEKDNQENPKDPEDPKDQNFIKKLQKMYQKLMDNVYIFGKRIIHYKLNIKSLIAVALFVFIVYRRLSTQMQLTELQFINLLETNAFKEVQFMEQEFMTANDKTVKKVYGTINNQKFVTYVFSFQTILQKVLANPEIKFTNHRRSQIDILLNQLYNFLDIISLIVIIASISKSTKQQNIGQQFGGGMNKTKNFEVTKNVKVKFKDVAGLEESKREVKQIVDFLVNPAKYHALGATIPKGVLLTGPPGTGKTLLAKACAGQAGVPFYSVSGSDFVQIFVGVGASRVRQLFAQAKKNSPSIIFIDQLDAVGKKRANKAGSNDERESTLNQLLVQMDGFGTNSSVIIMGATNRKQILDNALVRAGRFDRQVQVGLPDLKGRFQIFLVHLKPLVLCPKYTIQQYAKRLASLTPGFSGAEIANLCNQAAILAARYNKGVVQMIDFQISSQRVIGGVQRKGFVSLIQKKTVAYHECGHAVVSWFLQGADPLLKVTIIPRSKGALGFAQYFVNQNQLQTKQELIDRICFILGGRCAQLFFFKQVTTGAYDDLSKAYDLAFHIVTKFGMQQQIGYVAYPEIQYTKPYGQKVQGIIDRQIKKIIQECTKRTMEMVQLHAKHIQNLAEELLVKETLDVRTIQKILGKRPFKPNKTFEAYLQTADEKV